MRFASLKTRSLLLVLASALALAVALSPSGRRLEQSASADKGVATLMSAATTTTPGPLRATSDTEQTGANYIFQLTGAAGTPTPSVTIEQSLDGKTWGTAANVFGTPVALTAVGQVAIVPSCGGCQFRAYPTTCNGCSLSVIASYSGGSPLLAGTQTPTPTPTPTNTPTPTITPTPTVTPTPTPTRTPTRTPTPNPTKFIE